MPFPKLINEEETDEAMKNPQVGDMFHEMFSFYVYVLKVTENEVVTIEASPSRERAVTLPDDGLIKTQTRAEFIERFAYGSIDGYWVVLGKRDCNVSGWLEHKTAAGVNHDQQIQS